MKRNKRTVTLGHKDLAPLTEHILAQMGDEGIDIREYFLKSEKETLHYKSIYLTSSMQPNTKPARMVYVLQAVLAMPAALL